MELETRPDYINKKYTDEISSFKTEEERDKAARKMLDKSNIFGNKKERIYHKNRIYQESKLTNRHDGEEIDSFAIRQFNIHNARREAKLLFFRIPGAKGDYVEA